MRKANRVDKKALLMAFEIIAVVAVLIGLTFLFVYGREHSWSGWLVGSPLVLLVAGVMGWWIYMMCWLAVNDCRGEEVKQMQIDIEFGKCKRNSTGEERTPLPDSAGPSDELIQAYRESPYMYKENGEWKYDNRLYFYNQAVAIGEMSGFGEIGEIGKIGL